jgi:hypothetical protein
MAASTSTVHSNGQVVLLWWSDFAGDFEAEPTSLKSQSSLVYQRLSRWMRASSLASTTSRGQPRLSADALYAVSILPIQSLASPLPLVPGWLSAELRVGKTSLFQRFAYGVALAY